MMNGYATAYAVQKAKEHHTLKVGIHLVLTWGQSLRNDVPDLVTPDGTFKYNNTYRMMEPPNLAQVEKEWSAQIEARSEEHTSELQSRGHLVCRLLLETKKHNAQ